MIITVIHCHALVNNCHHIIISSFAIHHSYLFAEVCISILLLCCIPAVDCGDPGSPTNGQRSLSSTTYNSVVTYTCDVGYTLQGSNSRTCQSSGLWSGSVPQCSRMLNNGLFCCVNKYLDGFIPHSIIATCTNPCQNGGTCTAPDTCTCDVGWTGMQCETGG